MPGRFEICSALALCLLIGSTASALAQNNSGISPYGAQAYPYDPNSAFKNQTQTDGRPYISPYGAQTYPAPLRGPNDPISPYGAQTYPAPLRGPNDPISPYGAQTYPAPLRGPNDPISPYGSEKYPYRGQQAAPALQQVTPPALRPGQMGAPLAGVPANNFTPGTNLAAVPQEKAGYTLEQTGAWQRVEGMPASVGNPTQLAPGTYAAPPTPAGTVFQNNNIPPNTRPKSATPPNRFSDKWGMYPQNAIGKWVLSTGGQWGMANEGPDKDGMQKYTFGGVTGAGIIDIKGDGTWTLEFAGKKQTGRWADAPDTVHLFNLDGEEQFAYWNNKGQLQLQSKSGKLKYTLGKQG